MKRFLTGSTANTSSVSTCLFRTLTSTRLGLLCLHSFCRVQFIRKLWSQKSAVIDFEKDRFLTDQCFCFCLLRLNQRPTLEKKRPANQPTFPPNCRRQLCFRRFVNFVSSLLGFRCHHHHRHRLLPALLSFTYSSFLEIWSRTSTTTVDVANCLISGSPLLLLLI